MAWRSWWPAEEVNHRRRRGRDDDGPEEAAAAVEHEDAEGRARSRGLHAIQVGEANVKPVENLFCASFEQLYDDLGCLGIVKTNPVLRDMIHHNCKSRDTFRETISKNALQ